MIEIVSNANALVHDKEQLLFVGPLSASSCTLVRQTVHLMLSMLHLAPFLSRSCLDITSGSFPLMTLICELTLATTFSGGLVSIYN